MEAIFVLILTLLAFVFIGAIVASVALSRTGKLMQDAESTRSSIKNILERLAEITRNLSRLNQGQNVRPIKLEPSHKAQKPTPPIPEPLPPTVVADKEVELVEPEVPLPTPPLPTPPLPTPSRPTQRTAPPPVSEPVVHRTTDWKNIESIAGKRWLTWAGVTILFLSAAFFLRYAFVAGWIGPNVQVLLAVISGVVMVAMGEYFLRQDMPALGLGLIGGGVMVLYAALFAAYSPGFFGEHEPVVIASQKLTFALMCIVTILAMTMAIRHDAISISVLAILGGLLTPILVSRGTDARDALFSYILLLDLGVLGVAFYKKWRALDILAFVGTITLFWGWYTKFGVDVPVGPPLAWLGAFWSLFAIVPVAYHLRYRTPLTIERLVLSLMNATYGFVFAQIILSGRSDDLSWVALTMSGAYLMMGVLVKLRCTDTKGLFGFISLSMLLLTLFIPLRFELNGITLGWSAQAVALVYLGFLFDYRPVRIGGFITLLLSVARVFMVHFPEVTTPTALPDAFMNRNFWTMMSAPIACGTVAIIHRVYHSKSTIEDKQIQTICTIGAGLLALVLVSFELNLWFGANVDIAYREYLRNCSLAVLWALGATAFLSGSKSSMSLPLRIAGMIPLVGALMMVAYTFTITPGRAQMLCINPRFGATLLVCGVMWAYSLTWIELQTRTAFTIGSGLLTLLLFSVELDRWFWTLDIGGPGLEYLHHCGITVLWLAGTLAFLVGTKYKAMARQLRRTALLPLAGALGLIAATFAIDPVAEQLQMLFINPRFAAALLACGVAWTYSLTCPEVQPKISFSVLSSYLTVGLLCAEVLPWVWKMSPQWQIDQDYTIWWVSMALLSACTVVYLLFGCFRRSLIAYSSGLVPLISAWTCGFKAFSLPYPADTMMFLNPRFIAAIVTLGIILLWAIAMYRDRQTFNKPGEIIVPLHVWFTLSLLGLLSIEPVRWVYLNISDPTPTARMSLTLVWGLYASVMLIIGFWRRVMALRMAALALFGLTAVKLLVIDMSGVEQIYRIISFFVMGMLMIAASYLYHKAEKQLKESDQRPQDQ
ncbi:MAG: DUF2339 domain-containing protein [bacterium]|nr:DUF2339 domain-containing protein [bacterium]